MRIEEVDRALAELRGLPALAPDAVRSERTRARCRAAMARRASPPRELTDWRHRAERLLATAVVGALSALYLAGIVYEAIKVYGVPRA